MRRLALLVGLLGAAPGCGYLHATRPAPYTPDPVAGDAATPHGSIEAYFVGHATVLLKVDDRWIMTDPVLEGTIGLIARRHVRPGIDRAHLPAIDWVLISHAHIDHLNIPSLRTLGPAGVLAVPPGVVPYLEAPLPFHAILPVDTWASVERDGVRVTAVPARHDNGRYYIDALWSRRAHTGWIVEHHGLTVFFAGDTAYDARMFKEIGRRFPRIDLALIPAGPAGEHGLARWLQKAHHADPEEALQIFEDVGASYMIPIHHGTFFKSGPAETRAIRAAIAHHDAAERVFLLDIGGALRLEPAGTLGAAVRDDPGLVVAPLPPRDHGAPQRQRPPRGRAGVGVHSG